MGQVTEVLKRCLSYGEETEWFEYKQGTATDKVEWKPYSAGEQNVLDIAGPDDIRIKRDLLADQYKAVLPLVDYYQFMDKYFTPTYMFDILAAREQKS